MSDQTDSESPEPSPERPDSHSLPTVERVNTRYLETLMGYNARRAALTIIGQFLKEMATLDFRPVEFSVLSLVHRNPGITSRQLCDVLDILAPNLVAIVNAFEKRGWIRRYSHPHDGRALCLVVTDVGAHIAKEAETRASQLEANVTPELTPEERKLLIRLLKKIYK